MVGKPITVILHGKPVAKGRPRAFLVPGTKIIRHYTPKKTVTWEGMFRTAAMQVMGRRQPLDVPIEIQVTATFAITASWPAWKREMAADGRILHTARPDGDNIVKAVKDALNEVVYRDDSLIAVTVCHKIFGPQESVQAVITPLDAYPSNIKQRP